MPSEVALRMDPGAEEQLRDHGSEPRRQDDRIAQSARADEHGSGTLGTGPGRLRTQPGRISGLEEPSFHGEAG